MAKARDVDSYRDKLKIDKDDLETCLIEHPMLFWEIADAYVQAAAERDSIKLKLEELHAALDKEIRDKAAKAEEKTTETKIQQQIKDDTDMRGLADDLHSATRNTNEWGAMKEAFSQRGYVLRELVQIELRRMSMMGDIGNVEQSGAFYRSKKGDSDVKQVNEAREREAKPAKRFTKKR